MRLTQLKKAEELPEDVAAYYKYKKRNGRGLDDFVKKQSIDSVSDDKLLRLSSVNRRI
jgi:hypothetical protein